MAAYWLARAKIVDPVKYKRYTDQIPGVLEMYGGRALARGGDYEILEGPPDFTRLVVIEFDSLQAAKRCFESPEYQAAAAHRRDGGGVVELAIVEGAAPAAIDHGAGA